VLGINVEGIVRRGTSVALAIPQVPTPVFDGSGVQTSALKFPEPQGIKSLSWYTQIGNQNGA